MNEVPPPERDLPRSQDQTVPLNADLYFVARVACRHCGDLFPVTVQWPWQRLRSAHLGPRAAQLVLEKDGHVVREGVDVKGPLCQRCFDKVAPKALKEKKSAWKARLEDHRTSLEQQRKEAEEEKARLDRELEEKRKALDEQIESLGGG